MNIEDLIYTLKTEKEYRIRNGIYGLTQRELAYNSNKIEGSTLTKKQTESLFDSGTVLSVDNVPCRTKDIEEMQGHFAMFNFMLDTIDEPLSEDIIKGLHKKLKQCVFEDIANGYNIGEYKGRRNKVSDITTALPSEVPEKMKELLDWYLSQNVTLDTLVVFHARYEKIHPFQDGNGRTGRIILFRECLRNNITPFVIEDRDRESYLSSLNKAQTEGDYSDLKNIFEKVQILYSEQCEGFLMSKPKSAASALFGGN